MQIEPGDLVLLNFPFTSETGAKQRPAMVVLDTGDDDVLVARVTTQAHASRFDMVIKDWTSAGLIAPSTVRLHKLATIERLLVRRKLGRLQETDWSNARAVLSQVFCE
jgi:mRNA interferase MazF